MKDVNGREGYIELESFYRPTAGHTRFNQLSGLVVLYRGCTCTTEKAVERSYIRKHSL